MFVLVKVSMVVLDCFACVGDFVTSISATIAMNVPAVIVRFTSQVNRYIYVRIRVHVCVRMCACVCVIEIETNKQTKRKQALWTVGQGLEPDSGFFLS